MSDAERLEQLAALYAEHSDAVPEGFTFEYDEDIGAYVQSDGMAAMVLGPMRDAHRKIYPVSPWFLTLALGRLVDLLWKNGWRLEHDLDHCFWQKWEDHYITEVAPSFAEPGLEAAIAAYRAHFNLEAPHADS